MLFTMRVTRLLVAVTLLLPVMRARAADNFPTGWTFRRPLTFKPVATDAPGDNVGFAEFYANGSQRPDGADLRVTTSTGISVPIRILQLSANSDFIRIAFQIRTPENPYHVWWGNPNAEKTAGDLEIRRGVLAEVFTHPGVPRNDMAIERAFDNATPVGATFVPSIFLGYNPLGSERNALIHYSGQFKIDAAIKPEIAFTTLEVGVLKIDGKEVAAQFRGGLRGRARDSQIVDLTAGWHTLDVLQANGGGNNMAVVLDWRRPNEKGFTPFPPNLFAPVASATAGPLEKVGGSASGYAPDFSITPEAEAFVPPESFIPRYSFEAQLPENLTNPAITWDFGDGQVLTGQRKIGHYFLKPGNYSVTMSIKAGGGSTVVAATRRIEVPERMYSRFPQPPQDTERAVQLVLKDYDLKKLSGGAALEGMLFFKDQGNAEEQVAWGRAWLQAKDGVTSDKTLLDEASDLARLLESRKDDAGAAEVLRLASEIRTVGMLTRLDLLHQYVRVLCDNLNDGDAAMVAVKQWQTTINPGNSEQARHLAASTLEAAIAKGDGKLGQATVASLTPLKGGGYNDAEIKQGVMARNIEAYIRTGDFDTARQLLDQWELDYPTAIWDGFTRTLRVKLLAAQSHHERAAQVAMAHAKANPAGFYAAELLYRAAQEFKAAKQETQAKAAMDLLTSKYPESPYARGNAQGE